MRRLPTVLVLLLMPLTAGWAQSSQELFPAYKATPATEQFPGVPVRSIDKTPLSTPPYVFALEHRSSAAMSAEDASVVSSLGGELAKRAELLNFNLSALGWSYQQIVCPAFPDYVFLAFHHGPVPNGSSRFVAALARDGPQVRIVSTFSHGMLPFESPWTKPATYEVFNRILRRERGRSPMGNAPNWLIIAMCYAELSGYPVQVLTPQPRPGSTLDLTRLEANQPQLRINPDRSAEITFSDVSKPSITTGWVLRFNRAGQIASAAHTSQRQPASIALKP